MTEGAPAPLRSYEVQLVEAHCARCVAERTPRPEEELSDELGVRVLLSQLSEDAKSFACRLELAAAYPVHDSEAVRVEVTVEGVFLSDTPLTQEQHAAFVEATPIVLLWPYARAYVSDLGRMLGVTLPMLPTLDALEATHARAQERSAGEDG